MPQGNQRDCFHFSHFLLAGLENNEKTPRSLACNSAPVTPFVQNHRAVGFLLNRARLRGLLHFPKVQVVCISPVLWAVGRSLHARQLERSPRPQEEMTNPRHWELSAQNPHARRAVQQSHWKELVWHCPPLISGADFSPLWKQVQHLSSSEDSAKMFRRFTAACYRHFCFRLQQKSQASKYLSKTTHLAGNCFFPAGFLTSIILLAPKSAPHSDTGKPPKSLGLHCLGHLQPRLFQSEMLPSLAPYFCSPGGESPADPWQGLPPSPIHITSPKCKI